MAKRDGTPNGKAGKYTKWQSGTVHQMAKRDSTPNESLTFSTINDAYDCSISTNHEKILQFNRIKGSYLNDWIISEKK